MSRLRPLALATLAVFTLCLATAATAATAGAATKTLSPTTDCQKNNGRLTQKFTATELQHALDNMQPSVREYTTCYAAIKDQLTTVQGGKVLTDENGNSGSGGGSGTVILIIVIVLVILLGGGVALWAYRRNQNSTDPEDPAG